VLGQDGIEGRDCPLKSHSPALAARCGMSVALEEREWYSVLKTASADIGCLLERASCHLAQGVGKRRSDDSPANLWSY
jgi:hypothetical protein